MYHNVFGCEYFKTFQTQIPLHKQYIFDKNSIQSEYAFLFLFSIFIIEYESFTDTVRQNQFFFLFHSRIDNKTLSEMFLYLKLNLLCCLCYVIKVTKSYIAFRK